MPCPVCNTGHSLHGECSLASFMGYRRSIYVLPQTAETREGETTHIIWDSFPDGFSLTPFDVPFARLFTSLGEPVGDRYLPDSWKVITEERLIVCADWSFRVPSGFLVIAFLVGSLNERIES